MNLPVIVVDSANETRNSSLIVTTDATAPAAYPVDNVIVLPVSKVFRCGAGDLSGFNIKMDFGAAVTIDVAALISHNLQNGVSFVQINGETSFFNLDFQAELATLNGNSYLEFASSQAYRYWRFLIADATNPDGYIQTGYLVLALKTTIPMAVQPGWSIEHISLNQELENEVGVPMTGLALSRYRLARFSLAGLSEAEATTVRSVLDSARRNIFPTLLAAHQPDNSVIFGRWQGSFTETRPAGSLVTIDGLELREDPAVRSVENV